MLWGDFQTTQVCKKNGSLVTNVECGGGAGGGCCSGVREPDLLGSVSAQCSQTVLVSECFF